MEQDSPSSPRGLNLETAQPMAVKKLDSGTGDSVSSLQLTVKMVPEDKQTLWEWTADTWRKLWRDRGARVVIIIGLVLLLGVGLQWFLFFPSPLEREDTVGQITCFVRYPRWLAPRDEESFSITLFNSGDTDLTQVKVLMIFTDTLCLRTDPGGSTIVEFGNLAAGERRTRTARFTLERMDQRCPIELQAQLVSVEQDVQDVPSPYIMQLLPTPHYKTIVQKVWGFLLSVILAVLSLCAKKLASISGLEE
jgi:hypothetical protein